MQYLIKTLRDIFSMGFDVIIPISGAIVAFVIALAQANLHFFGSFLVARQEMNINCYLAYKAKTNQRYLKIF